MSTIPPPVKVLVDLGNAVGRVRTSNGYGIYLTLVSESFTGDNHYAPAESCETYMDRLQAQELVKALELAIDATAPRPQFDPTAKGY